MNLDTLLFEVKKLDLVDLFTKQGDVVECIPEKHARLGNIVICGYDKAETFLELRHAQKTHPAMGENSAKQEFSGQSLNCDEVDSVDAMPSVDKVVFFDDEDVNIQNFSTIVQGSRCYLVS